MAAYGERVPDVLEKIMKKILGTHELKVFIRVLVREMGYKSWI